MKSRLLSLVGGSVLLVSVMGVPQAYASTNFTTQHDHIVVNANTISNPLGFTYKGTTYMPIWYVMQALKTIGIQSKWNGAVWNLTDPGLKAVNAINHNTKAQMISINGAQFAGVQMYDYPDPSTRKKTVYAPVWYVMQVLKGMGMRNTWDGQTWSVSSSGNLDYGLYHKVVMQNQANDTGYWKRENPKYYLSAQTGNPFVKGAKNTSTITVNVGQTIYLEASASNFDVTRQKTKWLVDSPYATVKPFYKFGGETWTTWTYSQVSPKKLNTTYATFEASKPGVYTVQARV